MNVMSGLLTIGEAAARSGVPAKRIRYYESIGLIRPAVRAENGYRAYDAAGVATLRFLRHARDLGFSLEDCGELVSLWQDEARASADVRRLAETRLADIERKIAELERMRAALRHLVHQCHGDSRPDCPILDDLAAEDAAPVRPARRRSRA